MSVLELLTNGEVYAPEARGKCHLLVAAERVIWMGNELPALSGGPEMRVTDLQGARVIPGLIDAHVHLTGGGGEGGFEHRMPPVTVEEIARGGTTTVVGVLGTDDVTRTPGDLAATARSITARGLTAYCYTGGYHLPPATITGSVTRDIVHMDPVIGVGEVAVGDHRGSHPRTEDLVKVAAEAHLGGVLSGKAGVAHLHLGDGDGGPLIIREAMERSDLPPGVFWPTHVNRRRAILDAALTLVEAGVTVDVTAFPESDEDDVPAVEAIRRYLETGLPPERLTISSDAGGSLPRFDAEGRLVAMDRALPSALGDVLAELLAGGLPPERALPPFTANVARRLRLTGRGVLVPGAVADLVVLDDGGRARDVMARGCWVVRNGRDNIGGNRT